MADYTAIVETGEALAELLRRELTPEPVNDRELISLGSPFEAENNQVTIYLFHMDEDLQGGFTGYQQQSVNVQRMQPASFQLSYLITAHSKAPTRMKEPDQQRIIGKVIQTIKDNPVIPQELLGGSLAGGGANISLNLERPNFEQMQKIWNNTTVPYKLSVVCKVGGVLIDSDRTRRATRVREFVVGVEERTENKQ